MLLPLHASTSPSKMQLTIFERIQAERTHMKVKNVTYNFDPCLVRWRFFRPVCSSFTVFQNLRFETPKIVSYIFDPPGG